MSSLIHHNDWQPFSMLNNSELEIVLFENDLVNQNYFIYNQNKITFNQFCSDVHNVFKDLDPDTNFFTKIRDICSQCDYYFADSLDIINNKDNLSIFSLNINSISKNFDCFINTFFNNPDIKFDILGLNESKLTDEIENIFEISN